jgi:hypothetical protein
MGWAHQLDGAVQSVDGSRRISYRTNSKLASAASAIWLGSVQSPSSDSGSRRSVMPKARPIRATSLPILPKPTTVRHLPRRFAPIPLCQPTSRTEPASRSRWRAVARRRAQVSSARRGGHETPSRHPYSQNKRARAVDASSAPSRPHSNFVGSRFCREAEAKSLRTAE